MLRFVGEMLALSLNPDFVSSTLSRRDPRPAPGQAVRREEVPLGAVPWGGQVGHVPGLREAGHVREGFSGTLSGRARVERRHVH